MSFAMHRQVFAPSIAPASSSSSARARLAAWAAIRRHPLTAEVGFGLIIAMGLLAYDLFCAIAVNVQVRYVLTVWPLIILWALLALLIPARIFLTRPRTPQY
jgi:hypothetical protein